MAAHTVKISVSPIDLRAWRDSLGLTQAQAAEALGITRQNYALQEAGKTKTGISRTTALACAALAAGLKPWSDTRVIQAGHVAPESTP